MTRTRVVVNLMFIVISIISGCASYPNPETWKLPAREDAKSAMFIGRIALPDNKDENPDGLVLKLDAVDFRDRNRAIYFGNGEKSFVMSNNYFVVPNIKSGKYHLAGFNTGKVYNTLPLDDEDLIEIKPGQIKFVGSYDYLNIEQGVLSKMVGLSGSYNLRKAKKPTELEMLQWLNRIGNGSGWEPAIKKRIRELGGKP